MYQLPRPFSLEKYDKVYLDIETTGLDIYREDKTIGIALGVETSPRDAEFRYYPIRHRSGQNLNPDDVYSWLRAELRGKTIIGHNIGSFDLPKLKLEGLDLIAQGNNFRDTMLAAILHGPNAPSHSLDNVAKAYLGDEEKKVKGLDKEKLADYFPEEVAKYAEQDVRLCWMLDPVLNGHLKVRGLEDIYNLECRTIKPVVEMQANGLLFDYRKAQSWVDPVRKALAEAQGQIGGINFNAPRQIQQRCDELGIEYPWNWKCPEPQCDEAFPDFKLPGKEYICWKCHKEMVAASPHFGKKFLLGSTNPFLKSVARGRQLHKLLNTFLLPWLNNIDPANPILHYNLHQLRERDEEGASSGAVSGRFSCSSIGSGAQPQQVWSPDNQREEVGEDFILRSLFIPESGSFLSTDAEQIEFRLFAHFSNNPNLLKAYEQDPTINFHRFVSENILHGRISYKRTKSVNFGILYNMGPAKLARELGIPTPEAAEMMGVYDEAFPAAKEVRNLYKRQAQLGVPTLTIGGRRFDWPKERRKKAYVALNRLIQGSAADIMKLALVEAYEGGYFKKMRLTVHDELDGDIESPEAARALQDALSSPKLVNNELRVPLLWSAKIGPNWYGQ